MPEVEVKILEVDSVAVEAKLLDLGAEKVFDGIIQASLYDFPDKRLDAEDSFVRLRSKGDETELAFKKRIPDEIAKSHEELEVIVSDKEAAHQILTRMGLRETVRGRKKHRASYRLGNAHFELDTFEGMPTFLEIEVSQSAELQHWVETFGYTMEDAKAWGGKQVYEHYGIPYPRV